MTRVSAAVAALQNLVNRQADLLARADEALEWLEEQVPPYVLNSADKGHNPATWHGTEDADPNCAICAVVAARAVSADIRGHRR